MNFNPDYLSKPETETPKLIAANCETFDKAQKVFGKISSEYRVALALDIDYDPEIPDNISNTHISKAGGLPLFPKDREWPLCEMCGEEMSLKYQIRQEDAPALPSPDDKDMLLVFMCPEDCGEEEPEHEIIWQKESDILDPLITMRGRNIAGRQIEFHPFRDHMSFNEHDEEGVNFSESNLGDCEIQFETRTYARLIEGIADDSLDERLKHYGDDPLAKLDNMENEGIKFFDAIELYHLDKEKIGGYPSWKQHSIQCHGPYINILQIGWAEGTWHIAACPTCGELITEYQGT